MKSTSWTPEEIKALHEWWPKGGPQAVKHHVKKHRTLKAIHRKGNLLGLATADILPENRSKTERTRASWNDADERRLAELYPKLGLDGVLAHFPERTRTAIRNRCVQLGLKLSPELVAEKLRARWGKTEPEAIVKKQADAASRALSIKW